MEGSWKDKYNFIRPQSEYLYDEQDYLLVDYVGKFENLQEDFDYVCKQIGLNEIVLPHVNKSKKKVVMDGQVINPKKLAKDIFEYFMSKQIPVFDTYHEYYDSESKERVADLYKRDIKILIMSLKNLVQSKIYKIIIA